MRVWYGVYMPRVREAKARKVIGRKTVRGKEYVYEYYTLPLNLYLPKSLVEKWGTEFVIEMDEDTGLIVIRPKRHYTRRGLRPPV